MGWLQIDPIVPIAKGGKNRLDNLCLACELCNQYKWTKADALDPETNASTLLYNPRQQEWSAHFTWSSDGTEIIGKTVCGRATVLALRLNTALSMTVRRHWVGAGWHPPTGN